MSRVIAVLLAGLIIAGVFAWWVRERDPTPPTDSPAELQSPPSSAEDVEAGAPPIVEVGESPDGAENSPGELESESTDSAPSPDPGPAPDRSAPPANTGDRRFEFSRPPDGL